jgi:hypothetical protein
MINPDLRLNWREMNRMDLKWASSEFKERWKKSI